MRLLLLVSVLITSCASKPEHEDIVLATRTCGAISLETRNGATFDMSEDMVHMMQAEEGCIRHYGPTACLVRFVKTGQLSYYAICRKEK